MKQFLDTLAVFVGNLLDLRPQSWQASVQQARKMRESIKTWSSGNIPVIDRGREILPVAPESPYSYLGRTALIALGFVGLVWVVVQIVTAFYLALPFLLLFALGAWLLSVFGPKQADPVIQ